MAEEENCCTPDICKSCQCSQCARQGILSFCRHCNDMSGPVLFDDCPSFLRKDRDGELFA